MRKVGFQLRQRRFGTAITVVTIGLLLLGCAENLPENPPVTPISNVPTQQALDRRTGGEVTHKAPGKMVWDISAAAIENATPPAVYELTASGFPFPPPRASAFQVIPRDLLVAGHPRPLLKDAATELDSAFTFCGYGEKSYYAASDGFAMVSRIEQMNEDGTPTAHRWSLEVVPMENFSLRAYLRALFKARPGHYRVIAFVATSQPFKPRNVKVTSAQMTNWLFSGWSTLPEAIGNREYSISYTCTAFIYEFRRTASGQPEFVEPSQMTGRTHLEKAGLWAALKKPR